MNAMVGELRSLQSFGSGGRHVAVQQPGNAASSETAMRSATGNLDNEPLPPTIERLHGFARLETGWNGSNAASPTALAIATAERFLKSHPDWPPTRVEPSAMGGVGITYRTGGRRVYVEFYNDGKIHVLFSDRSSGDLKMTTRPLTLDASVLKEFSTEAQGYLNG
jgi:hypothetical protein